MADVTWWRRAARWIREDYLHVGLEPLTESDKILIDQLMRGRGRRNGSHVRDPGAWLKADLAKAGILADYGSKRHGKYWRTDRSVLHIHGRRRSSDGSPD